MLKLIKCVNDCGKEIEAHRTNALCGDCKLEKARKYREENHEKELERGRKYRKENPEKEKERHYKYHKDNSDKIE